MIDFLLGATFAMFLLKTCGYAAIAWSTVFAPIYIPVLLALLVILIASK
jgi:hypothetical protein